MSCPHATLKRLNGGRCPRCDDGARADIERAVAAERRAELIERARQELERASRAKVIMARRSLAWFVRLMWPISDPDTPLEWNWHHDVMCRHLQYQLDEWRVRKRHPARFPEGVMQNVVANFPPGTGKSRILSVMAPAWMWIDSDGWRVTCVSSNDAVVTRDHEMMGKIIRSDAYQEHFRPSWTIESDNARTGIVNTRGGARLSRTFFAGAVGLRGDALFFDDCDDPARVKSAAYRAERDLKWSNAWFNRVNDDRIATRWAQQQRVDPQDHTSTLIGDATVDEDGRADWAHLVLPLHWRPGLPETPIGVRDPRTVEGEVLHPARFTPRVIRLLRRALGESGFDQQYDQRSTPREAKLFPKSWWRFFQRSGEVLTGAPRYAPALGRPDGCGAQDALVLGSRSVLRHGVPCLIDDLDEIVISVDASFAVTSEKADGKSRDGLGVIGKRDTRAFVLKDATKRRSYPELKRAVKQLISEWPEATKLLIEEKANGAALIGELRTDPELRSSVEIVSIKPTESKRGRAVATQPAIEDGAVMLLDGADWLSEVVEEHAKYEGRDGDDSDRVDWIAQALRHWAEGGGAPWWMTVDEIGELDGLR